MPEVVIRTPTLHRDQAKAWRMPGRFKAIRAGRRWGKTQLGTCDAEASATRGMSIGWFAPETKFLSEVYTEILDALTPVKLAASQTKGVIRTTTNGHIDFWSLENDRAGRSRKYHKVFIDEGAFTKDNMMDIWEQSIKPTLLDYSGTCTVLSNTNGVSSKNFLWQICNEKNKDGTNKHGFVEYHAQSFRNPYVPERAPNEDFNAWLERRRVVFEDLRKKSHPLVYQQEYLAEFVDWSGVAFFELDKMLVTDASGKMVPLERPERLDAVFAVIDTAAKTGKEHDGTGVIYFGYSKTSGIPLTILDWDLVQIEGALLETWLPTVFQNLDALAKEFGARMGSLGAHIEDASSGTVLIQQAKRRGWPAQALPDALKALGKDGRAISVSGYVYRGLVKFTRRAFEKMVTFKGDTRNHLRVQISQFRVGDKNASKRSDDLADCYMYGVAISLGNTKGF